MDKNELQSKISDLESQLDTLRKELEKHQDEHDFDGNLLIVKSRLNKFDKTCIRCVKCIETDKTYFMFGYMFSERFPSSYCRDIVYAENNMSYFSYNKDLYEISISFNPDKIIEDIKERFNYAVSMIENEDFSDSLYQDAIKLFVNQVKNNKGNEV